MKKRYIVVILIVFGLVFWALTRAVPTSAPIATTPVQEPAPVVPEPVVIAAAEKPDLIVVTSPLPESTITASPVVIKGRARGTWFFEATAPVTIVNWDGLIIGEGYIQVDAPETWMTTDFVPFTGTIKYDASKLGAYKYGWIIMKKDNPSDDRTLDQSLEFKILFP